MKYLSTITVFTFFVVTQISALPNFYFESLDGPIIISTCDDTTFVNYGSPGYVQSTAEVLDCGISSNLTWSYVVDLNNAGTNDRTGNTSSVIINDVIGLHKITFTVLDDCGLSANCIKWVIVGDDEPPVISGVGSDIYVECHENYQFSNPTASDNFDTDVSIFYADNGGLDNCVPDSKVTRTWHAFDNFGNSSSASQSAHRIPDSTIPIITGVGPDMTLSCGEVFQFNTPIATDNCDAEVDHYSVEDEGDICDPHEGLTRTWTFYDDCGNSSSASQTIFVEVENEAPTLVTPPIVIWTCDGVQEVSPPVAADNCDNNVWVTHYDYTISSDTLVRRYTLYDDCGNIFTFDVEVPFSDGFVFPQVVSDAIYHKVFINPLAPVVVYAGDLLVDFHDDCDDDIIPIFTTEEPSSNYFITGDPVLSFTHDDLGYQHFYIMVQDSDWNRIWQPVVINVVPRSAIKYEVVFDENENCIYDDTLGISKWTVKVASQSDTFFAKLSSDGLLLRHLDTGYYTLEPYLGRGYALCEDPTPVHINSLVDTFVTTSLVHKTYDCAELFVDVGVGILRRCRSNVIDIVYKNMGPDFATGVYVDVELDPWMTFEHSIYDYFLLDSQHVRFNIGELAPFKGGTIALRTNLNCDSIVTGMTHCVSAQIYPHNPCYPAWNGSMIEVDGSCEDDSIRFNVTNTGVGDMGSSVKYFIYQDDIQFKQGNLFLSSGEEIIEMIAANGKTYRLETKQEANNPYQDRPYATIESCIQDPSDSISLGFVNRYPTDNPLSHISIDCEESRGSYDPNDKRGLPLGYSSAHFIEEGVPINYRVRFQNTGNDTAFDIVILDTISGLLDMKTLEPGASSHEYTFDIIESRTLRFKFSNIMLPDSNVNEPLSHGFLNYTITPVPDLPLETVITNDAAIYFDFNLPVITNETWHTIGENFIPVSTMDVDHYSLNVHVYPNPARKQMWFEFGNIQKKHLDLSLYNPLGTHVVTVTTNGEAYMLNCRVMESGVYFYVVKEAGREVASGKVFIKD